MRVIQLTQSQHTVVDDDVFEWASKFKWYAVKSRNTFYAARNIRLPNGKRARRHLHQEVLKSLPGTKVDHVDRDGLNNLRENLRPCTNAENAQNLQKHRDNVSGYKGVYFERLRGKYRAHICVGSIQKHLGCFDTALAAALAYDASARILHGAFARLNFPTAVLTTAKREALTS